MRPLVQMRCVQTCGQTPDDGRSLFGSVNVNVWKKQSVKWFKGEKRSSKGVKGAEPRTLYSKRFYGTLKTYDSKKKQVPLTEDEDTSSDLLKTLQRTEDERRVNGFTKIQEHRERSISEHLAGYKTHLEAKNNTAIHVKVQISRVQKLIDATSVKTIDDLDGGKIINTLASWRSKKKKSISVGSSNHYLVAIKGFTRWLWQEKRTTEDTFCNLKKLNSQTDRRRVRRAMTEEEVKKLLWVTQESRKTYRGLLWKLNPTDRVLLYSIAIYTGLRSIEIASLKVSSFDLETKTVIVQASNTKNRKKASLPIHPTLLALLKPAIEKLPSSGSLLFGVLDPTQGIQGKVFARDLKRAGIAILDDQGRVLDFHSLRYTFITSLAKAGVHPGKAQRLARHSDINLTMGVYTQLDVDDLRDAVESI